MKYYYIIATRNRNNSNISFASASETSSSWSNQTRNVPRNLYLTTGRWWAPRQILTFSFPTNQWEKERFREFARFVITRRYVYTITGSMKVMWIGFSGQISCWLIICYGGETVALMMLFSALTVIIPKTEPQLPGKVKVRKWSFKFKLQNLIGCSWSWLLNFFLSKLPDSWKSRLHYCKGFLFHFDNVPILMFFFFIYIKKNTFYIMFPICYIFVTEGVGNNSC